MTNQPHKIAIYSRKSKFTGKGESIENQIELCKTYIATHLSDTNSENIIVFEDEGYSGGHLDRPKFREMMSLVKKKEISCVVCYRLDRISRNIGDFAGLIEELNDLGCSFISIKEQFDTSSPMGRAMMYIASVFSQLERETIAERIRDNMRELAKTGRWLGGMTPTGYKSEPIEKVTMDGKVRKAFKLTVIKEEVALVRLIFSKFIETNSLTKTETYLIQNNYKTKNGRDFSRFTIRNILENPVYMVADKISYDYFLKEQIELFCDKSDFNGESGIMAYNKTIQKRGKAHEIRNMQDWIIAVGKHEGIISGKDWVKVQSMLEQNKDKNYRKPRSNVALLSGILFCGHCGDYMRPKLSSRKNAAGELIYSYLCSMKERSRMDKCDMKNPSGNMLDNLVCEEIKKLSENPDTFLKELEEVRKTLTADKSSVLGELDRLGKLKVEMENGIAKLTKVLLTASGTPSEPHILKQIEELDNELTSITSSIMEFESITEMNIMTDSEFDLLKDLLSNFASTFDDMSIEQKRMALRTFVKKIIWDGENAHIYLFGSVDDDVELAPIESMAYHADSKHTNAGENSQHTTSQSSQIARGGSPQPLCEYTK